MGGPRSTRRDVLQLTRANGFAAALLFMTPLVLVRVLDQQEYGEYRLLWLIANTATLIGSMGMDRGLLYFLPRSSLHERAQFVSQTLAYFLIVAALTAVVFGQGSLWLPDGFDVLAGHGLALGVFGFLWMGSSLVQLLPNADRNIAWQSRAIVVLALFRSVLVASVALVTRDLQAVLLGVLGFVLIQGVVLALYVWRHYGPHLKLPTWAGLKRQLAYSVPFGLSGSLATARSQMTQWVVAWMFAPGSLALFAVGISFNAMLAVLRQSVGNAVMPRMSAVHAAGDTARALELNNRGNVAIGVVVFPVVVFIWTFAAPLIELLYTADYLEAVAVLRVYLVLLIVMSIELATVLWILEQGRFVATVSAVMLIASVGLVLAGAALFGLVGVAWGAVAAEFANRLINFRRAAKVLGISFGRLQDWPTLGKTLAAAVGSGAMAGYGQATVLPDAAPVWQLLVGGGMACIGYPLLLFLLRAWWLVDCLTGRRGWLDARG